MELKNQELVTVFLYGLFPARVSETMAESMVMAEPFIGCRPPIKSYTPWDYDRKLKSLNDECTPDLWMEVIIPCIKKTGIDKKYTTYRLCPESLKEVYALRDTFFEQTVYSWLNAYINEEECEDTEEILWNWFGQQELYGPKKKVS